MKGRKGNGGFVEGMKRGWRVWRRERKGMESVVNGRKGD